MSADDQLYTFRVWAPLKKRMILHIVHPFKQSIRMEPDSGGYFTAQIEGLPPDTRYFYQPTGRKDYPDPGSHYQPEGVHGPSQIMNHDLYDWQDQQWRGVVFDDLVFYQLHVGAFTKEGTFDAMINRLDELKTLGISALQLMPVAQFPGNRNWGYDGVFPYAVQHSYGGPDGLKRLVDACHSKGLAVFLDVIYNHLGPEGNYFDKFGPYFTNTYCTPWGGAINFDGEWADGVREYYTRNLLFWFEVYHIDGIRLDAIHLMFDSSATSIFEVMHDKTRQLEQKLGRRLYLIAESDYNSPRVMSPPASGGYGFDAQWLDDFHHALYVLLDKKGIFRYADFGRMEQLAKAFKEGFVHSGEFVKARKRNYGASSAALPGNRFIVFTMNHDQVGNRVNAERLSTLVNFDRLKLAAAAIILSPYIPMLFMGEEYAEQTPFYYFVDYANKTLTRAVQKGRQEQLDSYPDTKLAADPKAADVQAEETFQASKLQWHKRYTGHHARMLAWHQTLLALRKQYVVLRNYNKSDLSVTVIDQSALVLQRQSADGRQHLLCLFNLSENPLTYMFPYSSESWQKLLDSTEDQWQSTQPTTQATNIHRGHLHTGQTLPLAPLSVVVYTFQSDM